MAHRGPALDDGYDDLILQLKKRDTLELLLCSGVFGYQLGSSALDSGIASDGRGLRFWDEIWGFLGLMIEAATFVLGSKGRAQIHERFSITGLAYIRLGIACINNSDFSASTLLNLNLCLYAVRWSLPPASRNFEI